MQRSLSIPKNYHIRKKVRGSKRKLRTLERRLGEILLSIHDQSLPHDKSLCYQVPSPNKLVDSTNSPNKLRRKFVQLLADNLIEIDRSLNGKYEAFLAISLPFLSQSRIEICIDNKHFDKMINKTDAPSTWKPMSPNKSLIEELNLTVPAQYHVKGYFRNATDANIVEENWIIWKTR